MDCKICGKTLAPEDKFCSGCGSRVVEDDRDPIFDVPFGAGKPSEPNRRPAKKYERENFQWDLSGFPDENRPKKTEKAEFNWDSVLEARDRAKAEEARKRKQENTWQEEPSQLDRIFADSEKNPEDRFDWSSGTYAFPAARWQAPEDAGTADLAQDSGMSDLPWDAGKSDLPWEERQEGPLDERQQPEEEAQEEADAPLVIRKANTAETKDPRIDKFYTLNEKNAAFQALLDQEYERLRRRIDQDEEGAQRSRDSLDLARKTWESVDLQPPAEVSEPTLRISPEELKAALAEAEEERIIETAAAEEEPFFVAQPIQLEELQRAAAWAADRVVDIAPQPVQTLAIVASETDGPWPRVRESLDQADQQQAELYERLGEVRAAADQMHAQIDQNGSTSQEETAEATVEEAAEPPAEASAEGTVEVVQPSLPLTVDRSQSAEAEGPQTGLLGASKTMEAERKPLTFSDIFSDEKEDELQEKLRKREAKEAKEARKTKAEKPEDEDHKAKRKVSRGKLIALDILIVILSLIVILTGIMVFAGDSPVGVKLRAEVNKVIDMLTGGDEDTTQPAEEAKDAKIDEAAPAAFGKLTLAEEGSVGQLALDDTLTIPLEQDYGLAGLNAPATFRDTMWYTDAEGDAISYSDEIYSTVIRYFADLTNQEGNGRISNLSIGQILTNGENYYVIVQLTEFKSDTEEERTVTRLVHLVAGEKAMTVQDVVEL